MGKEREKLTWPRVTIAPSAGSTVTCGSVHFYALLSVTQIRLEPLKSISTDLQIVKVIY